MPTSNRRLEANRRNAQLSTGPRTAAGKARVAQNRTTHALTGAHTLLPDEDPQAYAALLTALVDEHAPATETEAHQVELLAHTQWKLRRAAQLEVDALVSSSRPAATTAEEEESKGGRRGVTLTDGVMRAVRYQASIRRSYSLALAELHRLQAERRRCEQAELAQALDLQFLIQAQKAENDSKPARPVAELRQSLTPPPAAKPEAPSTP